MSTQPSSPLIDQLFAKFAPQVLSPSARRQWHDAVAAELAMPGVVEWAAVGSHTAPSDFRCIDATPRGAALLGSADGNVSGRMLTEIHGNGSSELVGIYREAYVDGGERSYLGEAPAHTAALRVLHHIVRTANGLTVMLTRWP